MGQAGQAFHGAGKPQLQKRDFLRDGIRHTPHLVPLSYSVDDDEVENDVIGNFHKGNKTGMQFNGKKTRDNGKDKK